MKQLKMKLEQIKNMNDINIKIRKPQEVRINDSHNCENKIRGYAGDTCKYKCWKKVLRKMTLLYFKEVTYVSTFNN